MSNADTMRQFYDRVNAGDIDGFAALIADDMIEHEKVEGLPQTKEGVVEFFKMFGAAFSDLRLDAEDVIVSGDKAWPGFASREPTTGSSWACRRPVSRSTSRPSTWFASTTTALPPSTGASPTR